MSSSFEQHAHLWQILSNCIKYGKLVEAQDISTYLVRSSKESDDNAHSMAYVNAISCAMLNGNAVRVLTPAPSVFASKYSDYLHAVALESKGDYQACLNIYETILRTCRHRQTLLRLAQLCAVRLAIVTEITNTNPTDISNAWEEAAAIAMENEDFLTFGVAKFRRYMFSANELSDEAILIDLQYFSRIREVNLRHTLLNGMALNMLRMKRDALAKIIFLRLFQETSDCDGRKRYDVIHNTGSSLLQLNDFLGAEEVFASGVALARLEQDKHQLAEMLYNQAYCLGRQEKAEEARWILQEALACREDPTTTKHIKELALSFSKPPPTHKQSNSKDPPQEEALPTTSKPVHEQLIEPLQTASLKGETSDPAEDSASKLQQKLSEYHIKCKHIDEMYDKLANIFSAVKRRSEKPPKKIPPRSPVPLEQKEFCFRRQEQVDQDT